MRKIGISHVQTALHVQSDLSFCSSLYIAPGPQIYTEFCLTLLQSEQPTLHRVLAVLNAIGLIRLYVYAG